MTTSARRFAADVIDVSVDDIFLRLTLADGRELAAPVEWFPRLRDGSPEQRANWRLIGRGEGVHWPDLDEDIAAATLLRAA